MSVSRHHADWLALVEVSGPFVSLPVLLRVFPQGLDPRDPAQAKALRTAHDEWHDNPAAPGKHRAWVLHVLTAVLGYPQDQITDGQKLPAGLEAEMPEMGETLRPDFALVGPAGSDTAGQAQLLIASYMVEQALDKPVIGKHWKATPATRMMELLHGAGVSLGLVTNGEHWMLVYAPRGETTGYASWYGSLWLDEPITLRAFHSLLGVHRFFGVATGNTLLALLKESASDQQEVTDQLGYQVREAVKVLVQSFDALDKESNRVLLTGVNPPVLYDAALTIMMRLVFLFSAEERGLLHLGKPLYDANYAVSTLQEQLQEVADRYGEEVLERRYDAWARLLATFRAVHGGIQHQDLLMQSYGGSLFDPDRYPFLEGRASGTGWRGTTAEPLSVNNRVVLHLLNSLQRLRIKVGAGGGAETRRVSFRALGVEQIGHVYEGLLDHSGVRANETVLGIKGLRNKEPEIALSTLELLLTQGADKLIDFLKEETGRSPSALRKTLDEGSLLNEHKLLVACGHDETLLVRLLPFANLIREDSFARPFVVLEGSVYVTAGTTRSSTGTHYTPPTLTEPVVQHALEPLVYEGPTTGVPRGQWILKTPKAILDLKICDMAMGSGAFLVQACRYLAERLTEAWESEEEQHPGQVLITPDGKFSEGTPSERLIPADVNERIAIARRVVADRCLYGVDINPMAVEMAKLSLWLITVDANRPFTFLDHAFKCGDSLLGVTAPEQLENFSLRPGSGKQQAFATLGLRRQIEIAKNRRELLEAMPSDTPEQIAAKMALYTEAEGALAKINAVADILVALELKDLEGKSYESNRQLQVDNFMALWPGRLVDLMEYAEKQLAGNGCFHWALNFPETIDSGGFDAFIGNPPFKSGSKISNNAIVEYRSAIVRCLTPGFIGRVNLCCYFLLRSRALLLKSGTFGFVVTTKISEGASAVCIEDWLINNRMKFYYAITDIPWPGDAQVDVNLVCASALDIPRVLNGDSVSNIGSRFTSELASVRIKLRRNSDLCFRGVELRGDGFIIDKETADKLIKENVLNRKIIKPYLNGTELNRSPGAKPVSFVFDFSGMDFSEASSYCEPFRIVTDTVKPLRANIKGRLHENDYWKFYDKRTKEFQQVSSNEKYLVKARDSVVWAFLYVPSNYIIGSKVVIFKKFDLAFFALLQSTIHRIWCEDGGSAVGTALTYNPSHGLETFPLPMSYNSTGKVDFSCAMRFYDLRESLMVTRDLSLLKVHSLVDSLTTIDSNIVDIRNSLIAFDQLIVDQYGWSDISLNHGLYPTKQGIRFTISETARREILDRLLALNHQRHADEEAENAALLVSASAKRSRKPKDIGGQILMEL